MEMTYRNYLELARQDASRNFFSANISYAELINIVCETTYSKALEIENSITLTKYQQSLLSSFVRSTVVSVELIINSELIEAVAILRKQVELLARLYELEKNDSKNLLRKTPKISTLKTNIKRLYSKFSEGAHSSTYGSMSLLGFYKNRKRKNHLFYPEFTENTEIIFDNWLFVFFEFTIFVLDFKTTRLKAYDKTNDEREFFAIHSLRQSSGLAGKFQETHER